MVEPSFVVNASASSRERTCTSGRLRRLGDPPRDDRGVLADADEQRRLPCPKEVNAEEEEPRDDGALAVGLEREAELVERLRRRHPRAVVRPKPGREEHDADAPQVEPLRPPPVERRRLLEARIVEPALPDEGVDEPAEQAVPLVAPRDALREVRREARPAVLRAEEVARE